MNIFSSISISVAFGRSARPYGVRWSWNSRVVLSRTYFPESDASPEFVIWYVWTVPRLLPVTSLGRERLCLHAVFVRCRTHASNPSQYTRSKPARNSFSPESIASPISSQDRTRVANPGNCVGSKQCFRRVPIESPTVRTRWWVYMSAAKVRCSVAGDLSPTRRYKSPNVYLTSPCGKRAGNGSGRGRPLGLSWG